MKTAKETLYIDFKHISKRWFESKLNKQGKLMSHMKTRCWECTLGGANQTYKRIRVIVNNKYRTISAHRLAYVLYKEKDINSKEIVMHNCDNTACCRSSHIRKGTDLENMKDKVSKERQSRGEKHNTAKLTERQVRAIRKLHTKGFGSRYIAHKYNMNRTTISDIVMYRIWSFVK